MKQENTYHIIDFFGNVQQISKFEYYCWLLLPRIFVIGMVLVLIGVIIDCIKSF